MGTVVLHVGAPKAGSTSIQEWLVDHADALVEEHDIRLVRARGRTDVFDPVRIHVDPCRRGSPNSGQVVRRYLAPGSDGPAVVESFIDGLRAHAEHHETVVVTSEAFAQLFAAADLNWLAALDDLAATHPVRVAYYVRPQHTALEASWRQWGFRSGKSPSEYLTAGCERLHYFRTLLRVREKSRHLALELRPFRADLLQGGAVVPDFVNHFLGLEADRADPDVWANRGVPLEVANLLSAAPKGRFWDSEHDNRRYLAIKALLVEPPGSGSVVAESHAALGRYCHRVFEPGNQKLIAELGWPTEWFVPPPDNPARPEADDLSSFDDLWRPNASETELAFLWAALDRLLDDTGL